MFAAPINGGVRPQMQGDKHPMMQGGQPPMGMRPMRGSMGDKEVGEYITDLDMQKYLNKIKRPSKGKGSRIAPFSLIFDEITVYLEFRSLASVPADSNPSGSSSILRKRP